METKKNILVIAGEVSGDMHGAALIRELKKLNQDIEVYGIGGNLMKNEGAFLVHHINRMAFLGFVEVIKHIPFIKKVQRDLISLVKEKNIHTAVLIDYPGFNLNLAVKLKELKVNVAYYISPQIWAWGKNRIEKIKRVVEKMIVVFPFEQKIYQDFGVDAEYVGHPLMEIINNHKFLTKEFFYNEFALDTDKEILLIMPGSRKHEIEKIFPQSILAAQKLADAYNMQIVVSASQNIQKEFFFTVTKERQFKVISSHTYELMKYSKFGIIKSGTSTLEAAIFQLPMLIVYKTNWLTHFIGKRLIRVKNIGMVNILMNEQIVPEFIQNDVSADKIFEKCKEILSNDEKYSLMKQKLGKVKDILGENGASKRAAQIIFNLMNEDQKN
ncbi:MAG: lipid-A-disaccharide synthase [Ignavibacteriaceae bacterium]|nr:lipid-A-disaccharide synthase [Ignavibacteriaceae bacterium]